MTTVDGAATRRTTPTKKRQQRKKKKISQTTTEKSHPPIRDPDNQLAKVIPSLVSTANSAYSFLLRHDLQLLPDQLLSLESLLASTSLSVSNLFSLLSLPPLPPAMSVPNAPNSSDSHCWFHRFLASADSDSDPRWVHFFNLTKPSFTLLLRLLSSSITHIFPLSSSYALAATLLRLAHGASFSALSRRFGIDSATACRAFYAVCKAINEKLSYLFEFMSDINRTIVGFGWISLPNCCGVLGLEKFEFDDNGKYFVVQALVDSEGRFLDVSAGWPCTMNPGNILRQSKLFSGVEESNEYLKGPSFELDDGKSIPQYILGDSCFPLLPWLLTPYPGSAEEGNLSPAEAAFNAVHGRAMNVLRKSFRRIRMRWKLVADKWKGQCDEAFPFVFISCCLLHNFCIKCSEPLPDESAQFLRRSDEFPMCHDVEFDNSGKKTRDALASLLVNQTTSIL